MCGIFGHLMKGCGDADKSRAALHTLTHRGPDQWGDYDDAHVYIGHRRLSVLDLSDNARQPMIFGGIVMAVNGEIWNFKALKEELDVPFRSGSDSEVILHGYRAWGLHKLLQRLEGMFAFVIYDQNARKIYIVRDRYGIKPLYYSAGDAGVCFASEAKALLAYDPSLRYFSKAGVIDWLGNRGSHSGHTIYHNIFRVLPGQYIEVDVDTGRYTTHKYYDLLDELDPKFSRNPDDLPDLLQAAVRKRMVADVPVGVQLSGGVDSSLVAHDMARASNSAPLQSFSIGFSEAKDLKLSEEPYARYVSEKLGLDHRQINITKRDVQHDFKHVLWLADGMLDFPNTIPIYTLCREAKPYVTALLTGEGADELFGGYGKFSYMLRVQGAHAEWRGLPDAFVRMAGYMLHYKIGRYMYVRAHYAGRTDDILNNLNRYISSRTIEHLWGQEPDDPMKALPDDLSFAQKLVIADHKTYLPAVLERQDKASMGAGVEARVPFMDHDLIQYALNLNAEHLFDRAHTKKILKSYAADIFNPAFAYRPKVGFPLPVGTWIEDPEGFGPHYAKIFDDDFCVYDHVDRAKLQAYLDGGSFDRVLLNYPDREKQWVQWFFMVLRTAQDVFDIQGMKP